MTTLQDRSAGEITHAHVRVEDAEVMVHRAGAGNPEAVLFLHGSGPGATGWSNWQFALPALGDRFDCVAPDYCGFGETTHPVDPPRDTRVWLRWRVQQMLGLLDVLGLEKVHLVGNSMGGAVSLALLAAAPERFDHVVLMGTGGLTMGPPSVELQAMVTFYDDPTANAMTRLYSYFIHDLDAFSDSLETIVESRLEMALRPDVRRSFEAMFSGPIHAAIAPTSIRRITHPVLLVHGLHDPIIPVSISQHLVAELPDAQLHVFGRCSHWTQIERAEDFHKLTAAFLTGDD